MNTFLVSNMFPSRDDGRYGIFVAKLREALGNQGWPTTHQAVIGGRPSGRLQKLRAYAGFYSAIIRHGLFGRYDVIWLHFPPYAILLTLLVAAIRRKPVVVNFHGTDLMKRGRMRFWLNRLACRHAVAVICPSEFFANQIRRRFQPKTIHVFPSCGVDPTHFCPSLNVKDATAQFRMGFVSYLSPGKGGLEFVQSLGLLNGTDWTATIVGRGPEKDRLVEEVDRLKLSSNVEFVDEVKHLDLPKYFQTFDVFVFPTKLPESLGLVGIEALACGVPVIAARSAAMPEYVSHAENGLLVDAVEPTQLSNAIDEILVNREEWASRRAGISRSVSRYHQSVVVNDLVCSLEEVLGSMDSRELKTVAALAKESSR